MWIVKNLSMQALDLRDLGVAIGPKEFFDLDTVGRPQAERSESLARAMQSGSLRTVSKQGTGPAEVPGVDPARLQQRERVTAFRETLMRNSPEAVRDAAPPPAPADDEDDFEDAPVAQGPAAPAATDIRRSFRERQAHRMMDEPPAPEEGGAPVEATPAAPPAPPPPAPSAPSAPPVAHGGWDDVEFTLPEYLEEFRKSLLADVRAVFEEYLGPPDKGSPGGPTNGSA